LSINKERRECTQVVNKERKINAKYKDYDWLELVMTGKINGLLVLELDKYLDSLDLSHGDLHLWNKKDLLKL
jgi:hypothetical protein